MDNGATHRLLGDDDGVAYGRDVPAKSAWRRARHGHTACELHLHHGTLIGILLPHILRFNEGHADAYADLADAMGVADGIALHDWMMIL